MIDASDRGNLARCVSSRALGVFLNTRIPASPGTYRVSATVTFKKTLHRTGE